MKRLFIAINILPDAKKRIEVIVESLKNSVNQDKPELQIRWPSLENWHLTLVFLGYQPDEAINPILESIKETVKNFPAPTVEFENIIWAPPNKPPRMVWLTGTKETSKKLDEIKKYLKNELIKNGVKFQRENRSYNAHLTLARFQPMTRINADINADLRGYISENQRTNQRQSALAFCAKSLDLMESHLKRTGAEYETLAELKFKQ